jgi:Zn-dependent M28 family amino/carboxypeptidase
MPTPDFSLIKQVQRTNIERDVKFLATQWPNRHTLGPYLIPASEYLEKRMREMGYKDVSFFAYKMSGKDLRNVVTHKPGTSKTAKMVFLGAHFDSRQANIGDPNAPAPGANDNATGVAVLLEVARLLAPLPLVSPLRIFFFSGEEQDLWGSAAYAKQSDPSKVKLVFNVDQIGYPPKDRAIFVDEDRGGSPSNNAASKKLVARVQELAKTVVKVPTRVDPAYGSDYIPFEQRGIPIVGLYEAGTDYPDYHKSTDTPDKVDFAYVTDFARLTLASILDFTQGDVK